MFDQYLKVPVQTTYKQSVHYLKTFCADIKYSFHKILVFRPGEQKKASRCYGEFFWDRIEQAEEQLSVLLGAEFPLIALYLLYEVQ